MNVHSTPPVESHPAAVTGSAPPAETAAWFARVRRVSWGAILGGFFAALALQLMLSLLGLAFGFWSIEPTTESNPVSGLGIGSYLWWLVTGTAVLFAGGCLAGRMAGTANKMDGMLQGVVVWGLLTVFGFWMAGSAFGTVVNATTTALSSGLQVVGYGLQAAGTGVATAADYAVPDNMLAANSGNQQSNSGEQMTMRVPSMSYDQMAQELNEILQETGKDALEPEEMKQAGEKLQSVATSAAQKVLKQPDTASQQLDRVLNTFYSELKDARQAVDQKAVVNVLTANSDMSEAEAKKTVNRWQENFDEAQQQLAQTQDQIQQEFQQAQEVIAEEYQDVKQATLQTTDQALDALAHASLWSFVMLLFGLGAAAGGGFVGAKTVRQIT